MNQIWAINLEACGRINTCVVPHLNPAQVFSQLSLDIPSSGNFLTEVFITS